MTVSAVVGISSSATKETNYWRNSGGARHSRLLKPTASAVFSPGPPAWCLMPLRGLIQRSTAQCPTAHVFTGPSSAPFYSGAFGLLTRKCQDVALLFKHNQNAAAETQEP